MPGANRSFQNRNSIALMADGLDTRRTFSPLSAFVCLANNRPANQERTPSCTTTTAIEITTKGCSRGSRTAWITESGARRKRTTGLLARPSKSTRTGMAMLPRSIEAGFRCPRTGSCRPAGRGSHPYRAEDPGLFFSKRRRPADAARRKHTLSKETFRRAKSLNQS